MTTPSQSSFVTARSEISQEGDDDEQEQDHGVNGEVPLMRGALNEPLNAYTGENIVRAVPRGLLHQFSDPAAQTLSGSTYGSIDVKSRIRELVTSSGKSEAARIANVKTRFSGCTPKGFVPGAEQVPERSSSIAPSKSRNGGPSFAFSPSFTKTDSGSIRKSQEPAVTEYYSSAEPRHGRCSFRANYWRRLKRALSRRLSIKAEDTELAQQRLNEQRVTEIQWNSFDALGQSVAEQQRQYAGPEQTVSEVLNSPRTSLHDLDDIGLSPRRHKRLSKDVRSILSDGTRRLRHVEGQVERQVTLPGITHPLLPKAREAVQRKPLDDFDQVAADLIDERVRKRESQGIDLCDEERQEAEERLQRHKSSKRHEEAELGAIAQASRSRTRFDID
ncbi:hypothetical protein Tdes44962_MAKER05284 [Teratosphaeria destructans]|uniref:Uncharacterized protein n=1 Tax=Teratosphaeria destructans TaxID=418781 RepID=A0A9W7SK98_9PEZI|nr:hypothetical protein Tdes44962_MAKER05284 [Teratosphaeria destructans]